MLDYTKGKARTEILSNRENGVFESYRLILHRGLSINDERRLDVEAKVLNPRRAKNDKDVPAALQEWRQDQGWLIEAGYDHANRLLKDEGGRPAMTILVKMKPVEGKNPPAAASLRVFGKSGDL